MIAALVVGALTAGCASAAPLTAPTAPAPAPSAALPPLELIQTAPVETDLGLPHLPEAHEAWLAMIAGATRTIDVAQFYITSAPGERMAPVLDALVAAAGRGVAVRVLAEAKFAAQYPDDLARLGATPGVTVAIWDAAARLGGILHAKYFIVDGRDAYLGSHNFDWRALAHILELGVRVRVPEVVAALSDVFETDWALAHGAPDEARVRTVAADRFPVAVEVGGGPVTVAPALSPTGWLPDEATWDLPALVGLIDGAARTVRVQLLSYEGTDGGAFGDLEDALRRAAARGVTVQLMLSHWNQRASRIGALKALQEVDGVEVRLVTIPEARGGFIPFARVIHAKLLAVDGERGWIGTSNWGRRYFHGSRNVGLVVAGATFVGDLDAFFLRTWDSAWAEPVDPTRDYPEPRVAE